MPLLIHALVLLPASAAGLREVLLCSCPEDGLPPPELIAVGEVGAIVLELDRTLPSPSERELLRYAGVVDLAASMATVLPMRYGSSAASREALSAMLSQNRDAILRALSRVEGRAEFSARIPAPAGLVADGGEEDAAVPLLLQGEGAAKEYLRRRYGAYRRGALAARRSAELGERLKALVAGLDPSVEFRSADSPGFLLDFSFLIGRGHGAGLRVALERFAQHCPEGPLLVTGPWPPYNFSELSITA